MTTKADFPDTIYAFEPETKDGITGGIWCDKPTVAPDDAMSYLSVDQIRMIIAQRDDLQERVAELEKAMADQDGMLKRSVLVCFSDSGNAMIRWYKGDVEMNDVLGTQYSELDESYRMRLGTKLDDIRIARAQS